MVSVNLPEKTNFARLHGLLVDKGTEALRNVFDAIHPPARLPTVLAVNRISLRELRYLGFINHQQWFSLFPLSCNPPDSKAFDLKLLTILLQNICGLPSTGWDVMPTDGDRSVQANITRIELVTSYVFAKVLLSQGDHSTLAGRLWQKISRVLVEFGIPQRDIEDIKTCSLGNKEEMYQQMLQVNKKDHRIQVNEANCRGKNKLQQLLHAFLSNPKNPAFNLNSTPSSNWNYNGIVLPTRMTISPTMASSNLSAPNFAPSSMSHGAKPMAIQQTGKPVNQQGKAVNKKELISREVGYHKYCFLFCFCSGKFSLSWSSINV